jgi:tetratricopeptide (TPR) repeat protein
MARRPGWLVWALVWLAWQAAPGLRAAAPESAEALWQQGQDAMRRGCPRRAIACYQESLARAPSLTRNHLSLAAAYLALGDRERGQAHLARYVAAHPGEIDIRSDYAELLALMHREQEARAEFEGCIAAAQELGPPAFSRLIRCHRRVMEIAEAQEDAYAEHLHRGIGLYLLARESAALKEAEAQLPSEGLFFKAAGELNLAREKRPDEARPAWYLYAVWSSLDQHGPAVRCLRDAETAAPFSELTAWEQRGLQMAAPGRPPCAVK